MGHAQLAARWPLRYLLVIVIFLWYPPVWADDANRWIAPRVPPNKPIQPTVAPWQSQTAVELKLREGTAYRLEGKKIISHAKADDLSQLNAVLQQHPIQAIGPLINGLEPDFERIRAELEQRSVKEMPDLRLWLRVEVQPGASIEQFVDDLNALADVEIAYPAPLPAPLPVPPPSSDFVPDQGYLDPASASGIDAKYAWTSLGDAGSQVRIVDVEYAFNPQHEDLPSIPVVGGAIWNGYGNDHGTAVLGELGAVANGFGVTGIAHNAELMFASPCSSSDDCGSYNPANAINAARAATAAGDVILIELQYPACGSEEYGPLEWLPSVFDAIQVATAAGRHVVEAAGNGGLDLEAAGCDGRFDRSNHDSGASIVGAGAPPNYSQPERSRLSFSSYGSRVDLQGWGRLVVTTGYGDLYGSGNEAYTQTFSGTSSASPIVAGAVAVLSSIEQRDGTLLSPAQVRDRLVNSGTAQQDALGFPATEHIGALPNLKAALELWDECRAGPWILGPQQFYTQARLRSETTLSTSSATVVNAGADITWEAGQGITLNSGFRVANGGRFQAGVASVACAAGTSTPIASKRRNRSEPSVRDAGRASLRPPVLYTDAGRLPIEVASSLQALGVDPAAITATLLDTAGHWLVFSTPQALAPTDANAVSDTYHLDLFSEQLSLISRTQNGFAGNGASRYPAADASGELIVFESQADNLVAGDTNGVSDIFLHDLALGHTERLTDATHASAHPGIDAGGTDVVYDQQAASGRRTIQSANLVDLTKRDRLSLDEESNSDSLDNSVSLDNHHPAISGDGRFIAYLEEQAGREEAVCQVHLYDRRTEVYHRQPCPQALAAANESSRPMFNLAADTLLWHLPGQAQPVRLVNPLQEGSR